MTHDMRFERRLSLVLAADGAACAKKKPPVARPMPPPPDRVDGASAPPAPPTPVQRAAPVPPSRPWPTIRWRPSRSTTSTRTRRSSRSSSSSTASRSSAEGSRRCRRTPAILKKYPTWVITIEGHCDERGTAEYNLALGERRALAAKNYLVSLGIAADRLRTVSYGKEFPFDPGHDDRRGRRTAAPLRGHQRSKRGADDGEAMPWKTALAWWRRRVLLPSRRRAGARRNKPRNADDGGHPDAAGAESAAAAALLGTLQDTLKTVTTQDRRAGAATRKAMADQKLAIDSIGDDVRIVREKIDETNVRISSMSQEIEALRQAIPQPRRAAGAGPRRPTDPRGAGGPAPPPPPPPTGGLAAAHVRGELRRLHRRPLGPGDPGLRGLHPGFPRRIGRRRAVQHRRCDFQQEQVQPRRSTRSRR